MGPSQFPNYHRRRVQKLGTMLRRSPRDFRSDLIDRTKNLRIIDVAGESGRALKCFVCGGCRKNHLPRAHLKDERPDCRRNLGEVLDAGDEKTHAAFDVAHRQPAADFSPGAQLGSFEHLGHGRRSAQKLNAGAQGNCGNRRAGFQRRARTLKRQMAEFAEQTGNRPPLGWVFDRTNALVDLLANLIG